MALFFSESQILSILNDIIKNESLFPESQILYNWFHIMEADKHTTRYFCDVIEQFHELGGNVESVVHYRKVQENGAFIKIGCSRMGTLRSCFLRCNGS